MVHDIFIKHGVKHQLPYAVCGRWMGAVCDKAW